jgi:CRP/FNR family transcriptional regulator, anaerobic regulatory protein
VAAGRTAQFRVKAMQSADSRQTTSHEVGFKAADSASNFSIQYPQHLATGAILFEPGEQRRLYRVESGAICHYMRPADGEHEIIEFAFAGDIVGLGHSPTHVSTAKAMVESNVSVITDADLDRALQNDSKLFFKLADAGEREFDYFRNRSLEGDLLPPLERVANYLLAISSIESSEGREATIIADDFSSDFVADQLQISVDTLTTVLLSLQRSGFVDVSDIGLRILDVPGLEKLAATA